MAISNHKKIEITERKTLLEKNECILDNISDKKLISANYHLTKSCNYNCRFCFARFKKSKVNLPLKQAKKIVELLAENGTEKITLVGGEPFLYPRLGELVKYCKKLSLTTMIVTNGSLISNNFLERYYPYIDWIGLSIDSAKEKIELLLGRQLKNSNSSAFGHVYRVRKLVPTIKRYGINIKINTVVTELNWEEDLSELIYELEPSRWKVFQVLKINNENDHLVDPLLISKEQFQRFIDRHLHLDPIAESNEQMIGSYVMIDPQGRFFDNTTKSLRYSPPILEVGVNRAFNNISFIKEKFYQRQGVYDWKKKNNL